MASKQRNLSTNPSAPNGTNDLEVNLKRKNVNEALVRKPQHKKPRGKWNAKLVSLYGLRVIGHDEEGTPTSAMCRFCKSFGREAKTGATHKAKKGVHHYFNFRTDHILSHLVESHPQKWQQYQALDNVDEMDQFFAVRTPFLNTIASHGWVG